MTNKKDDIKSLAEGFLAPDVENEPKVIELYTFRAVMKDYVVDKATAEKFQEQLANLVLNVKSLDKSDYIDKADFFSNFNYRCNDGIVEDCHHLFKNADEILDFGIKVEEDNGEPDEDDRHKHND